MGILRAQRGGRPGRALRIATWTAAAIGMLALLFLLTSYALLPFANREPSDDTPIAVAPLMMLALAVLTAAISLTLYAGLLVGVLIARLRRRWRPPRLGRGATPPASPPSA